MEYCLFSLRFRSGFIILSSPFIYRTFTFQAGAAISRLNCRMTQTTIPQLIARH